MNVTMASEWKTGLSPRARGRMHIALPTDNDNTTDYHEVGGGIPMKQSGVPASDLSFRKEFAQTGNFPARL